MNLPAAITWASANTELLGGGAAALGVAGAATLFFWRRLAAATSYIKEKYVNRLQICVISDVHAKRFDDFIELYHSIFNSDERIATTEIHEWLNWKAEDQNIQYRLYLSLKDSRPVAVAISFYQQSSRMLFVPYMGVTNLDDQWKDTRAIVRSLVQCVSREASNWQTGLVEVADPAEPGIRLDEARRRLARIRRLRALATREGLEMRQIDMNYMQPSFANDVDLLETCGMLLFAVLKDRRVTGLPREVVIGGLDFIYNRIYRPSFCGSDEDCAVYEKELDSRLVSLRETLDEIVALKV